MKIEQAVAFLRSVIASGEKLTDEDNELIDEALEKQELLVDSQQSLLRSAKRVNGVMHGNPTYMNVAFTMRSAITKAERLAKGLGKGEEEVPPGEEPENKPLQEF